MMRKFIPIVVLAVSFYGCSNDDGGYKTTPTPAKKEVHSPVTAPVATSGAKTAVTTKKAVLVAKEEAAVSGAKTAVTTKKVVLVAKEEAAVSAAKTAVTTKKVEPAVKEKVAALTTKKAVPKTVATMPIPTAADIAAGEKVFKKKCKTCHSIGANKILGPGLLAVSKRHSYKWMRDWVSDPQGVWTANDAEVMELKKRVGGESRKKTKMKVRIKAADVDSVVAYISTL